MQRGGLILNTKISMVTNVNIKGLMLIVVFLNFPPSRVSDGVVVIRCRRLRTTSKDWMASNVQLMTDGLMLIVVLLYFPPFPILVVVCLLLSFLIDVRCRSTVAIQRIHCRHHLTHFIAIASRCHSPHSSAVTIQRNALLLPAFATLPSWEKLFSCNFRVNSFLAMTFWRILFNREL